MLLDFARMFHTRIAIIVRFLQDLTRCLQNPTISKKGKKFIKFGDLQEIQEDFLVQNFHPQIVVIWHKLG